MQTKLQGWRTSGHQETGTGVEGINRKARENSFGTVVDFDGSGGCMNLAM